MHASDDPRCTCLLMRRAARRITQLYDEHLRPAGLKTSQFSLLANLRQADGVAMGELADRLSMDRTTLTRNLKPLVAAGWLQLAPGDDGRSRSVHLTPAGRDKRAEAQAHWRAAQELLNRQLGVDNVLALHDLVDQSLERLAPWTEGEGDE